ncbi:MAG: hypothetical protein LBQ02_03350 [Candidatus Nomurabacteria bacterium]|jgi:hypothetical protein|nr:hypothetical protein [Candidatus Nomurabacteria bacterium]
MKKAKVVAVVTATAMMAAPAVASASDGNPFDSFIAAQQQVSSTQEVDETEGPSTADVFANYHAKHPFLQPLQQIGTFKEMVQFNGFAK